MIELNKALEKFKQSHKVIDTFHYSKIFQPNGEKSLYDWLKTHRKEHYTPLERLVFIQDQADVYDYQDDLGKCTQLIQKAIATIDISNCFITIITTNPLIAEELKIANQGNLNSVDLIQSVVVPGEYSPVTTVYSDTFCAFPWMHLYIGPEGDVLPCCAGNRDHPLGHIDHDEISNIYNNKNFVNLRSRMIAGKRTKECDHCWVKEDSGLASPRMTANSKYMHLIDHIKTNPVVELKPKYIELRLNKLCNLKCRSCSAYYSSAIAQEIQEMYNVQWPSLNNTQRKKTLDKILHLLPGIDEIYFAGGEPLLTPEHFTIINELINLDKTDVKIFYNTNFMQLSFRNQDLVEIWKKFNSVTIGASLDAYGVEAEYLRNGTKWDTIESNLAQLKSQSGTNIKFSVTSTVGFLNVESLIHLQKNWVERGLVSIDEFSLSQFIFDSYLSIQVAPYHHKIRLESIIKNHISWVKSQGSDSLAESWQQLIDYMWGEDRSHLLFEFQRITTATDQHRGQSFHKIFPQFQDLIPLHD